MKKISAYVIIVLLNILIFYFLNLLFQFLIVVNYGSGAGLEKVNYQLISPFVDLFNLFLLYIIYKKQSIVKNKLFFISIALVLQYWYFEFYFSYIFR